MSVAAIVTGLGHGLVSDGLGGGPGGYAAETVAGWIRLRERSRRLHRGDIAAIDIDVLTYDDVLTDPGSLVVTVQPPDAEEFAVSYDDGDDALDRITRRGEGQYTLYVEVTEERGTGIWYLTATASGGIQASEPGQFIARAARV